MMRNCLTILRDWKKDKEGEIEFLKSLIQEIKGQIRLTEYGIGRRKKDYE